MIPHDAKNRIRFASYLLLLVKPLFCQIIIWNFWILTPPSGALNSYTNGIRPPPYLPLLRNPRAHCRNLWIDWDIACFKARGLSMKVKLKKRFWSKNQTVCWTSKMEHPGLVAFTYVLPLFNGNIACWDFCHTNSYKADEPNQGVIRFNKNQCSCRYFC